MGPLRTIGDLMMDRFRPCMHHSRYERKAPPSQLVVPIHNAARAGSMVHSGVHVYVFCALYHSDGWSDQ